MLSLKKLGFAAAAISASVLGCGFATEAQALVGYSLSINDPVFNSVSGINNVPDFTLENISMSAVQITDFNLTIGAAATHFYDFVRLQSVFNDPSGDLVFTLNSPELINDSIGDPAIDYDFTGFDPGDIFQFEVDVDPLVGDITVDYREILFPSAVLTVGFSNGETLSQILNPSDTNLAGYNFTQTSQSKSVPEPSSIGALALLGLGAVVARCRRRAS